TLLPNKPLTKLLNRSTTNQESRQLSTQLLSWLKLTKRRNLLSMLWNPRWIRLNSSLDSEKLGFQLTRPRITLTNSNNVCEFGTKNLEQGLRHLRDKLTMTRTILKSLNDKNKLKMQLGVSLERNFQRLRISNLISIQLLPI
ncbi:hypothetical protein H0H92_000648, partial [Tricholoma furcatifolium]